MKDCNYRFVMSILFKLQYDILKLFIKMTFAQLPFWNNRHLFYNPTKIIISKIKYVYVSLKQEVYLTIIIPGRWMEKMLLQSLSRSYDIYHLFSHFILEIKLWITWYYLCKIYSLNSSSDN